MKHTIARILMVGTAAGGLLAAGTAAAIEWNVTGFARQEIAYGLGDNPNNLMTNPFNRRKRFMGNLQQFVYVRQ